MKCTRRLTFTNPIFIRFAATDLETSSASPGVVVCISACRVVGSATLRASLVSGAERSAMAPQTTRLSKILKGDFR